ncbi:MAG: hypothetical protein GY851_02910 [bacterium]|nr:hypothetical protein [bacterium]
MTDEMFFNTDADSLRRGKRRTKRTETCRPCVVWPADAPEIAFQGVAINVTPYGLLIRMLDSMPPGTQIKVQLMRDEEFREPLASPLDGIVVRVEEGEGGFTDHGVQIEREEIQRAETKPIRPTRKPVPAKPTPKTRMHTVDFTIGDRGIRRTEK